jgi:hypothetical protein
MDRVMAWFSRNRSIALIRRAGFSPLAKLVRHNRSRDLANRLFPAILYAFAVQARGARSWAQAYERQAECKLNRKNFLASQMHVRYDEPANTHFDIDSG